MSEGLRAEDVKAAVEWFGKHPAATLKPPLRLAGGIALDRVLAAARAWLASQEQIPDIEAAARELARIDGFFFDAAGHASRAGWVSKAQRVLDAALVGFHPQPEGDER